MIDPKTAAQRACQCGKDCACTDCTCNSCGC
jgi:hypothetical protein